MGLCVQGGAPLIGGRGMLADAICLWIAVVLSVFGVASVAIAAGPDSDSGVSDTDRESSVLAMGSQDGWTGHYRRSGRSVVQSASPERPLLDSPAHAARHCGPVHVQLSIRQQSRSLSLTYLSLSGARPPTQGGWGAVHHSTPERARGVLLKGSASSQGALILKGMKHACAKRDRLDLAPLRLLISRTRPVFL
jgi:hypothetical protein